MSTRTAGPTFFPPLGPAKVSGGISPKGWDRCVLAGQVLPAHASILRGGIKLKADPKKKAGADGTRPCYHGLDPQPLQVELETYSDDDRESLAAMLATVVPVADRQPKPVSIDHPSIRHLGITAVQIVGVGPFIPVKPGVAKVLLDMEHWQPPKSPSKVATFTPTRAVRNLRKEAADKATPPNPKPTQRAGFGGPPAFTGAAK
jgi:hypothetical protein